MLHHTLLSSVSPYDVAAPANESKRSMSPRLCRSVLLVSPAWPPSKYANGIVSTVVSIKSGFESLDVNCSVVSIGPKCRDEELAAGVYCAASFVPQTRSAKLWQRVGERVRRIATFHNPTTQSIYPRIRIPGFERALDYIQRNEQIDLIEVEETRGLPGMVACLARLPVVARLHGPWFLNGMANGVRPDDDYRARVQAEGAALAKASGVSSPSRYVLGAVEEKYQIQLPCRAVIPNSVEPIAPKLLWDPRAADPEHILFVGRFDRHKGADLCVRAFVKLLAKRPQARLTIVGPDNGIIDKESGRIQHAHEWLQEEVKSSEFRARIKLSGRLSPEEIVQLRRTASLTIVPSRFENFPTTVLESFAQGCPIIASNVGGIPEIIEHQKNGLLCSAEDIDQLAAQILCLLENQSFAASLGNAALQDSLVRFSPRTIAQQTLDFYQEVCARHSRGEPLGESEFAPGFAARN